MSGAEGRAVCGPRGGALLEERSSRFGRGREDGMDGEPGSFLTLIMGGAPPLLPLNRDLVSTDSHGVGQLLQKTLTYWARPCRCRRFALLKVDGGCLSCWANHCFSPSSRRAQRWELLMRGCYDLGSTAQWQPTSASAGRGGARDWAQRSCCCWWRRVVVVQRRRSTWLEESSHLVCFRGRRVEQ